MSRVLIHTAVPDARRALAATMSGLSGNPSEHSVECVTVPGGPSALWNTDQGYGGKWWAASQAYVPSFAQDLLTSGYMLGTESWYVAIYESGGQLIQHNLPGAPADSSFEAFLAACGLERVVPDV